jgi:hypothetical protein
MPCGAVDALAVIVVGWDGCRARAPLPFRRLLSSTTRPQPLSLPQQQPRPQVQPQVRDRDDDGRCRSASVSSDMKLAGGIIPLVESWWPH